MQCSPLALNLIINLKKLVKIKRDSLKISSELKGNIGVALTYHWAISVNPSRNNLGTPSFLQ